LVSNLPRYSTFCAFCEFSVHVQIRSTILSIWTD
jgi:hypothetical protein